MSLAQRFEHTGAPTFGVEEELLLLDPVTLELLHEAPRMIAGLPAKLELPACQLEIAGAVHEDLGALGEELARSRARVAGALEGRARLLAAGAHPFAPAEGALNAGAHYERLERQYGMLARRQLVCGLHVHVGLPGGAARVLAVHNALRSHLPDIAALAANAPLQRGVPTGMASVRPFICGLLPRQGIPPAYAGWRELEADLAWGRRAGALQGVQGWWWELRLHPQLGTIELRAADSQSTPREAAAMAAFGACLVLWLAERHDAGDLPPPAPAWRIAENRFSAARHGVAGRMADLQSGRPLATAERLERLLDALAPLAGRMGASELIASARGLIARPPAQRQLRLHAELGVRGATRRLSELFAAPG